MRVHHLNCGTLNLPLGVALVGTGGLFTPARGVIHCVLVETDDGLLLVDTGFGTRDCITPTPFIRLMMALGGHPRDLEETASSSSFAKLSNFQHLSVSLCFLCALCVTDFGIFEKVSGSETLRMNIKR